MQIRICRDDKMKLEDVCEVYSGYALKEFHDSDEGYPVIKIGNICSDGTIDLGKCQYTTDSVHEKFYSKKGDIYVALSGATTGKIGIMDTADKYIINQRVGIVRRLDMDLSDQYIKYFLMNKTEKILEDASGCAQPNISPKQIGQYEFPSLDYFEMNQISEILDKVSSVITRKKLELQKLDELIKARFVELFEATSADKCSKRIKDYAEVLGGYAFKSDLFCANAIPVIRISNINNGCVDLDPDICFDESFWEQNKRFRAEQNDILMAMSGATTGKSGIYKEDVPALINQRVACIRARDGIACPMFLFVATQLEWMYNLIQETSAGCAQPNISTKQIENMPVPDATYEQQQQFTAFVEQADKSKVAVQKALDEAQLLFDSLMQEYFG